MKKAPVILLVILLAGFILGVVRLFSLRFEAGDIYPEYSSLRADPVGTKALYDSLDRLVPTLRAHEPIRKHRGPNQTTWLFLGAKPSELYMSSSELRQWETFITGGGRLVVAMLPGNVGGSRTQTPVNKNSEAGVFAGEEWGFAWDHAELPSTDKDAFEPAIARRKTEANLPGSILLRSPLSFTNLNATWRVIYEREGTRPVVIERNLGNGSIVLTADGYLFSNEALARERNAELLAWYVGAARQVVFDEHHLGVQASHGIASLARKYRLHGTFAVLAALAALFIWKTGTTLVPRTGQNFTSDVIAGKDASSGFINLLRRNIAPGHLLGVCLSEWKQNCARETPRRKLEKVQAIIDAENQLPPRKQNPVRAYVLIAQVLAKREKA